MTEELQKLCEDIKRLVPPSIPQAPTGQFETFISQLKGKVKDEELDSIHRAYNYFNRLLGATTESGVSTPITGPDTRVSTPVPEKVISSIKGPEAGVSTPVPEKVISSIKGPEAGLSTPITGPEAGDKGSPASTSQAISDENKTEMITILYRLANESKKS